MDITPKSCRICLSVSDFNVSLFSNYCRRINMVDKILVCLKLFIEETDCLTTICYKCAENIERYYEFAMNVKKCQNAFDKYLTTKQNINDNNIPRRHVASYVREQVLDADYTFSFLEMSNYSDKKDIEPQTKHSSPFFSYFSPPNVRVKQSNESWKRPRYEKNNIEKKKVEIPKHLSADIFESQSEDNDEMDFKRPVWKLTPDDTLIRRVREKCFGPSDY